jgi:hypothetical protein
VIVATKIARQKVKLEERDMNGETYRRLHQRSDRSLTANRPAFDSPGAAVPIIARFSDAAESAIAICIFTPHNVDTGNASKQQLHQYRCNLISR